MEKYSIEKKSNRKFTLSKQKPSAKNASQKLISPKQSPTKKSVKKVFGLQNKQQLSSESKDAVIICMTTRDETYEQLRDENYFLGLMLRRKQDPIFKPIDFIKNFVGVEEEHRHTVFCKHEQGRTRYPQLFQRSKSVIRAMGSNIIAGQPKYVSPEEEALFLQHLANKHLFHYAYYTLYKIISYVEAFHDEKITLISAKFLINQLKELYLLQVYSLKRHELTKYTWNQETYLQKVADNENKLLMRSPQKELDSTSQQKMSLIQKQMRDQYQQLKNEMLGQVQHNDRQYYKNNAFFAILHPELTETIGEILKDKTMTVKRFQAKYLGYKDAKKSVAVDFNSSLVKTVHKMSPALRTSKPHQLQNRYFPKTASIQRPAGTRPASIANTISTLNRSAIFL